MKRDDATLAGLVISPGTAFGYAIVERPLAPLGQEAPLLAKERVESEVERLNQALLEVRDLSQNLRRALTGSASSLTAARAGLPAILFSSSLGITEALRARRMKAAAFVTSSTAFTSHGAIFLRASGIPALGGVDFVSEPVAMGDPILVDAIGGTLLIDPSEQARQNTLGRASTALHREAGRCQPPLGIRLDDGSEARLLGNIDHPSQAGQCLEQRLSGIGLFRTEFMVLDAGRIPGEEEQFGVYGAVLEQLGNRPVMIRTFDLGGDKTVAGLHQCSGANPALGVRGLRRHILRFPEELKTQLRAILRAAAGHTVTVLLPMVTGTGDLVVARDLLRAAKDDLSARDERFSDKVRVAAMIEVPSAAINIADLLPMVDAVSIGTNDLIQYLTASDRDNEAVAQYQEIQTSGLAHLLEHIIDAVRAEHRIGDLAVCGEFASTAEGARLLTRLGVRSLSVFPSAAPAVREALEKPEIDCARL